MSSSPSSIVAWTDHQSFIHTGLRDLFSSGKFSDFEIRCHERSFRAHKLVLGLFTDYFNQCDGLWIQINVNVSHMESLLKFIYLGQVTIAYDQMEGFLDLCKFLGLRLFKGTAGSAKAGGANGQEEEEEEKEEDYVQERYELNDFQLMCRICYKCWPDEKTMKKHVWACRRPKTFFCTYCNRGFQHRMNLAHHERTHTGEKPFRCDRDSCERSFAVKSSLTHHVQRFHDKVRIPCPDCKEEGKDNRSFASTIQLHYHRATVHTKEKRFACVECGACFPIKSVMVQHMRRHETRRQRVRRAEEAKAKTTTRTTRAKRTRKNKDTAEESVVDDAVDC